MYGLTRGEFRRLPHEEKLEIMEAWFRERYEDPAERTPYESAEGGYIWIWGGPYDAQMELEAEFSGLASARLIGELVRKLQAECYQWAPTPKWDDDEEIGDFTPTDTNAIAADIDLSRPPQFGDEYEQRHRAVLEGRLGRLEAELDTLRTPRGMIGHNQPPEPIDTLPLGEGERRRLAEVTAEQKADLAKPQPDIAKAIVYGQQLRSVFEKLLRWTGKKIDLTIEAFLKALGDTAGKSLGLGAPIFIFGLYQSLASWLAATYEALVAWLRIVTTPF